MTVVERDTAGVDATGRPRARHRRTGRLTGWVGGACSEPIVVREALRALADGEPRLVRIGPPGRVEEGAPADAVVAESMCASEGIVEVLVEPELPAPLLAVVGDGPAALTLEQLASAIGWRVVREPSDNADAVVVATMGHGDEEALRAALDAGIGYVGLVASARRAETVVAALRAEGVDEEALARVRSPAGLDLGPSTQPEIAVAVLAELVAWSHERRCRPVDPGDRGRPGVRDGGRRRHRPRDRGARRRDLLLLRRRAAAAGSRPIRAATSGVRP